MSARYVAVNWNRQKRRYDTIVALGIFGLVALFFVATVATHPGATPETALIRGFGLTAFVLLHVILCIGPLCRLDRRFLPLLYNRRHLGVAMALLATAHAGFALFQFHALGDINPFLSLLTANGAFGSLAGFPFELLGLGALLILILMAATSHDFWLSVLTPRIWKSLHMLVYFAYALLVAHVGLGAMQAETGWAGPLVLGIGAATVIALHLVAGRLEVERDRREAPEREHWVDACSVDGIAEGRARVALVGGERVAIFRHEGRLSCVSNVCRHQNGPLGEGKIIDGCITCPWHGYQYAPDTGTSPPPFDDKVATYHLRLEGGRVLVHAVPNAPGTRVAPVPVSGPAPVDDAPFYVGYLDPAPAAGPRPVRRAVAGLAVLTSGAVLLLALAQTPFAPAVFEYGHLRTVTGTLSMSPYPLLTVDSGGVTRRYLLAGQGKHGAAAAALDGRTVRLEGTLIQRGNSAMFEVASLTAVGPAAGPTPAQTPLGRFTLTGEIVDSKCWTGVMNPGEGKTHLACAVRCLSGGLPPLLVLRDGQGREEHLVLTDEAGAPMPREVLPRVGRPVSVTGAAFREGDMLFLRAAAGDVRPLAP